MTPSTLADALDRARTDWLNGQRDAWTRYTECLAQLRSLDQRRAQPTPVCLRPMTIHMKADLSRFVS